MVTLRYILASLLVVASFEPLGIWFLSPIGYAIWIYGISKEDHQVRNTFLFGFISSAIVLQWSGVYVGPLPWIALSFLQALYLLPVAVVAKRTSNIGLLILLILLSEEIRARFPFGGFGWTRIAFSQHQSPLAPLASIGGVALVSYATLIPAWFLIRRDRKLAIAVFALLIVSASSLNSFLLPSISLTSTVSESDHSQGSQTLRVRAIQGGTPSVGLDFNSRAMGVLKMHIEQTKKDFQERDELIVWPENAIDIDPVKNVVVSQLIKDLLQEIDRPLLAGAIISTDRGPVNSIVHFDRNGEIQGIYEKRYLTPFGEYIPMRSIAEVLSPYAERVNDFVPGNKETVFHINNVNIASVICYEIINDGLVRSSSRNSDLLFIHTNSATFAGTSEGDQQLAITQLRAIEHQRSLLSVSTTGPSALVNERGEVVYRLAEGDRGSISTTMQVAEAQSISSSLGGVANILVLLLALLSALAGSMRQMRFRR